MQICQYGSRYELEALTSWIELPIQIQVYIGVHHCDTMAAQSLHSIGMRVAEERHEAIMKKHLGTART
jgi:hypothetical protein